VERACRALEVCCLCDLRYGGQDLAIIERLGNSPIYCDYVLRDGSLVLSELANASREESERLMAAYFAPEKSPDQYSSDDK
jgi:hypothetical protein